MFRLQDVEEMGMILLQIFDVLPWLDDFAFVEAIFCMWVLPTRKFSGQVLSTVTNLWALHYLDLVFHSQNTSLDRCRWIKEGRDRIWEEVRFAKLWAFGSCCLRKIKEELAFGRLLFAFNLKTETGRMRTVVWLKKCKVNTNRTRVKYHVPRYARFDNSPGIIETVAYKSKLVHHRPRFGGRW